MFRRAVANTIAVVERAVLRGQLTAIGVWTRLVPAAATMATQPAAEFGADYRVGHATLSPGDLPYDTLPSAEADQACPAATNTVQTTGIINIGYWNKHIAVKVKYLVRVPLNDR